MDDENTPREQAENIADSLIVLQFIKAVRDAERRDDQQVTDDLIKAIVRQYENEYNPSPEGLGGTFILAYQTARLAANIGDNYSDDEDWLEQLIQRFQAEDD